MEDRRVRMIALGVLGYAPENLYTLPCALRGAYDLIVSVSVNGATVFAYEHIPRETDVLL